MKTHVKQWGNSAVVRIPKPLLQGLDLAVGSPIEVNVSNGHLVVEPVREGEYTLEALLDGITDENLHAEVDSGKAVGREIA